MRAGGQARLAPEVSTHHVRRLRGVFIVQESIHADAVSRHETSGEAIAAIDELVCAGLAEPGQFNVREIDDAEITVRVFGAVSAAGH
jgi:hypothetical protein